MKKANTLTMLAMVSLVLVIFSSCSSVHRTMREPNSRVEFQKGDFTYSSQVSAEASTTRILGIDWSRLFNSEGGAVEGGAMLSIANIPVVGNLVADKTANYALYNLMQSNPGYDVIFYPQYETTVKRPIGLGFIYRITTVKATARLGKLN